MRSSRPRLVLLLAFLAALCACGETWRPVTYVEGLRVLAIRAEPADLNPGDDTKLTTLLLDPRDPDRENTMVWLACDPDPLALDQPVCAKFEALQRPQDLVGPAGLPEGVHFIGYGPEARYDAPKDLFAPLAADDPVRQKGIVAIVLMMAIATPPPDFPPSEEEMAKLMLQVKTGAVDSVLAMKRVVISEQTVLNANPELAGVSFDGELWGPGLRPVKLRPGTSYTLSGEATAESTERYVQLDPDGKPVEKDEKLSVSWFSTAGDFESPRTEAGTPSQSFVVPWPFDRMPEDRQATMYLVLRDGRGGASWMKRGLFVCDPFLEAPAISAVEPASAPPATRITLRGSGLSGVIDVRIGSDGWLADLQLDAASGALTGIVPSEAAPGPTTLTVRGKSCLPDPRSDFTVSAP